MDNFFGNSLDFNYFKKALKITDGESIIITISANDSSLAVKPKYESNPQNKARKSMSNKFEPSPFGKFFGSQKRNTAPVDMNDFSSWKNKNYRRSEERFEDDFEDEFSGFSLAKYMKDNSGDKFNELDQARTELQKPIEQLSSDDPTLKKFSLDSYMHKLEESILAKDKFAENEDLLEPIVSGGYDTSYDDYSTQQAFGGVARTINKYQDEDFSSSDSHFEQFAFDDTTFGSEFSLDQGELDKLKKRLDKMEKQSQEKKEKPGQRLLLDEGLFGDDHGQPAPAINDFESLILKEGNDIEIATEEHVTTTTKTVTGKSFSEVAVTPEAGVDSGKTKMPLIFTEKSPAETPKEEVTKVVEPEKIDEVKVQQPTSKIEVPEDDEIDSFETLKKSDILTKDSFKKMTDEFMTKITEMYKPVNQGASVNISADMNQPYDPYYQQMYPDQTQGYPSPYESPYGYTPEQTEEQKKQAQIEKDELEQYKTNQQELQKKLMELVEDKNKTYKETQEKLRSIEEEKNKINEEYQNKLKEMEETYNKKYEEFKQKMILDSNTNEMRVREAEERLKNAQLEAEKELQNRSASDIGIILGREIKSYFNISNLEMDKKLIEVSTRLENGDFIGKKDENIQGHVSKSNIAKKSMVNLDDSDVEDSLNEINATDEGEKSDSLPKATPRKRTTAGSQSNKGTTPRKRKKTRRMDSDITGGIIDF